MAKYEIEFEITGLKLKIKGDREDVPLITENLGRQVAGLLQPTASIVEGEVLDNQNSNNRPSQLNVPQTSTSQSKRSRPRRKRAAASTSVAGSGTNENLIDWKHDPAKWGNPLQSWSTASKAIWLLCVVGAETGTTELSAPTIQHTFNRHFKQSGTIRGNNISRDLGRLKTESLPKVGEDTTKDPSVWYLTHEGDKRATDLVAEALKPTS